MFTYFLLIFVGFLPNGSNSIESQSVCLSAEEVALYDLITEYRNKKRLHKIPVSKKLTEVAQLHAKDLHDNHDYKDEECNMHSWGKSERWSECCYKSDHSDPNCMWDKPSQINGYSGAGYEISYFYSGNVKAAEALAGWKQSKSHNEVVLNLGIWKDAKWNAIGIGIYKTYATVWFGMEKDDPTKLCN